MKQCAYCDKTDVKITSEHVVSKGFIDKYYKIGVGYAKVYDKYTQNFLTINDVCQKCNNENLSLLDSYFLEFYEKNIPENLISKDSVLPIKYDFDKLSKWLLKTLYNSERKHSYENVPKKLHRFKNYILGKDKRNKLFKIYLELLQDVPTEEIEKYVEDKTLEVPKKLTFLRMGTIVFSNQLKTGIKDLIKHFTSSNFVFHVFILDPGQHKDSVFNEMLRNYFKISKKSQLFYLNPNKTETTLKASSRTIIDILLNTMEGDGMAFDKLRK